MNDELRQFFIETGKKSWEVRKQRGTHLLVSKAGKISWEKKTEEERKLQISKMIKGRKLKRLRV